MSIPRTHRHRTAGLGALAASAMLALTMANPAGAATATGTIQAAGGATAVADSYVVVLKDGAVGGEVGTAQAGVASRAASLATSYGGEVDFVYGDALNGFAVTMPERAAKRLAAHPAVDYVAQNHTVGLATTQLNPPSWGLDRIDQRNLPLNNAYSYNSTGAGVLIYIIDTGIRITHQEFGGRASHCHDSVDGSLPADDGNGHGTHVAGTAAGTTVGVAKQARLCAVRVLDNGGGGTYAGVLAGVNFVTADHDPGEKAVANMSLGGSYYAPLNTAVANSVADGVVYAVAAGNSNANACNYSPASTPTAITVGATQSNDARASYSNWGSCVDLFAPGSNIYSSWNTSDSAYTTLSGTSMAAPHVAGAAARVLQVTNYPPAQVASYLISQATTGVVGNPGSGSPNRLLYLAPTF